MKKKRIYLDTSFFMAEFEKKSIRHKILTEFIKEFEKLKDAEFCYSKWCLSEIYNRLTKDEYKKEKIEEFIKNILDRNKVRSLQLKCLDVSPNENYNFDDFFNNLGKDLIKYKTGKDRPGLGDIIHIRIMKNNRVNIIFSFDSHFDRIQGIKIINAGKVKKKVEELISKPPPPHTNTKNKKNKKKKK